jgi:acetyltransferase-like isoleucine patch superfamily enzyme
MNPIRKLLSRFRAGLAEDRIRYSAGSLTQIARIGFLAKSLVNDALIISKELATGIFFWPIDLVRLMRQMEILHFAPMRKMKRGHGCVVDCQTWIVNGENVELGNYVKLSSFSTIMAGVKSKVRIGDFTIIGPGVLIVSFNHGRQIGNVPFRYQAWEDVEENEVCIGENVWIGGSVVILPGTTIGCNSVIGAGSVVKGIVPEGSIYINSSSKIIRTDVTDGGRPYLRAGGVK